MLVRCLIAIIHALRPLLGPPGACIYDVSCREYAVHVLKTKNTAWACVLITGRLISCNPITVLIRFIMLKHRRDRL